MSRELLLRLRDAKAFDQSPSAVQMAALHVPFDSLVGDADKPYEARFLDAVRRGERVALIGDSGAGKTSITEYVLNRPGLEGIAPLRVRLGMQAREMESDPAEFPRLMVKTISKQLSQKREVRDIDQAVRGGPVKRSKKFGLGAGFGWLKGDLAVEIGSLVTEPAQGEDVIERAKQILGLIQRAGYAPTLVLDDTDQWIRRAIADPEPRIASFFGSTLRLIAENLPAACVIAVHTEYLTSPYYLDAKEFLHTRVTLPALPNQVAMATIITKRIRVASDDPAARVTDVVDDDGLRRLFDHYAESGSVRRQMSVLHGAVVRACEAGAEVVSVEHVVSEIAAS